MPLQRKPVQERIPVQIGKKQFLVSREVAADFIRKNRGGKRPAKQRALENTAIRLQLMHTALERKANAAIQRMQSDPAFAKKVLDAINELTLARSNMARFTATHGASPTGLDKQAKFGALTSETLNALQKIEQLAKEL